MARSRGRTCRASLGLASAVFFAFTFYAKRLLARLPAWTVLFYGFLVAALFWMVFAAGRDCGRAYPATAWGLFLLIALGSALVPFALFYFGLARLDASRAGVVALLEPIVAIGSSAWWLREGLTPSQGAGAALILLGVGLSTRSGR
jgi:DME family drug/metabolite transporter